VRGRRPMGIIKASRQPTTAPIRSPRPTGRTHESTAGIDTLSKGVCEHVRVLVRMRLCVARLRDRLRRATVVLQRQGETKKAPGRSAATKHKVTQTAADRPVLSMTQRHRIVIGRGFGLLN
jgi:hypothetical protein